MKGHLYIKTVDWLLMTLMVLLPCASYAMNTATISQENCDDSVYSVYARRMQGFSHRTTPEQTMSEHQARGSIQYFIERVLDAWTLLDTVRAIAQSDRQYLYRTIIKTYLRLYGALHAVIITKEEMFSDQDVHDIECLLVAFSSAHRDLFPSTINQEEYCAKVIMENTIEDWNSFRFNGVRCTSGDDAYTW